MKDRVQRIQSLKLINGLISEFPEGAQAQRDQLYTVLGMIQLAEILGLINPSELKVMFDKAHEAYNSATLVKG